MQPGTTGGIDHDPSHQIVEYQVCVDFLEHTGRRLGAEILNVEPVLPLAIDGFDLPATVIEANKLAIWMRLRISQRSKKPAWSKPRSLVTKQTG